MPAGIMRRIVREVVECFLPAGALQAIQVAEESERAGLRALGAHLSRHGLHDFMGQAPQSEIPSRRRAGSAAPPLAADESRR